MKWRGLRLLLVVLSVGCGGTPSLKPADSQYPVAGACSGPTNEPIVTITINLDVPGPRCAHVTAVQRLRVVNYTNETVRVRIAHFEMTLMPGEGRTLDAAFGTYLAPGVHDMIISIYGGGGAELWLIEEK